MKKSVREMGKYERMRHGLTFRTLTIVLAITLFIGVTILVAGFGLYYAGMQYEYCCNTYNMAKAVAAGVDRNEMIEKSDEILKVYDSIPESERGDGSSMEYHEKFKSTMDLDFLKVKKSLQRMQKTLDLRNAFVVAVDQRTNRMIYLVDADSDPETFCYPGTWDEYSERDINNLVYGEPLGILQKYIGREGVVQATITNLEQYGLRCTGGETIVKINGYIVMVCLDETLEHLESVSMVFLSQYIILMFIVITIAGIIAMYLMRRNLVKPVNTLAAATRQYAERKHKGEVVPNCFSQMQIQTGDEVEELSLTLADMEKSLAEYEKNLTLVTAKQERINTELNLAKKIQQDTLPSTFPAFPDRDEFDICAIMDPAKEVGGDFYNFALIDEDHLGLMIADVSGKGVPAALFMMVSKAILDNTMMIGLPPAKVLERANNTICYNNVEEMFVTVWLGILEISTGRITAANAGHEKPVIIHRNGEPELLDDKHGFVIGGMEGMSYKDYDFRLEPGDQLFLYTDGVAEATSASTELFGTERILTALEGSPDLDPRDTLEAVRSAVDEFTVGEEQFDDLTIMCLKYYGTDRKKRES